MKNNPKYREMQINEDDIDVYIQKVQDLYELAANQSEISSDDEKDQFDLNFSAALAYATSTILIHLGMTPKSYLEFCKYNYDLARDAENADAENADEDYELPQLNHKNSKGSKYGAN